MESNYFTDYTFCKDTAKKLTENYLYEEFKTQREKLYQAVYKTASQNKYSLKHIIIFKEYLSKNDCERIINNFDKLLNDREFLYKIEKDITSYRRYYFTISWE